MWESNIHFNSQVLAVCQYLLYLYILENKSCDYLRVNSYLSKPKKIGVKIYDPKLGLLTSRKSYRYEQGCHPPQRFQRLAVGYSVAVAHNLRYRACARDFWCYVFCAMRVAHQWATALDQAPGQIYYLKQKKYNRK